MARSFRSRCDEECVCAVSIEEVLTAAVTEHEHNKQELMIAAMSTTKISLGVDSGAAVTVIPPSYCNDYPILPNAESKRGHAYRAASGTKVYDQGTRAIVASIDGGSARGIKARVAEVVKGLLSVYEQAQAGHAVLFSKQRSFCKYDGDGKFMKEVLAVAKKMSGDEVDFKVRNRTYEMDLDVQPYSELKDEYKVKSVDELSSFSRQVTKP